MDYLLAFLVGGSLCALGQTLYDRTRLTMGHVMVIFVVLGAVLTALGLYEPLIRIGGAGATIPVSNFGFVLTRGAIMHLEQMGLFGLLNGIFSQAGAAVAAAIILGFLMGLLFHPKG
ncbi:MAG: SpoVA/SpoVAEb family sporulation membrane protein [Clostridia bacterium]|nr:stage V sporulation protein AE [Bacillota bacterium]MBO2520476.1 stage V sporulation protein AE [Bacillota bacterium]